MSYKNDSSGDKIIPNPVPEYTQPHVTVPTGDKVQHMPTSIIVKPDIGGFQLNFTTTGSINATVGTNGAWVDMTATGSGGELNVSPTAWKANSNTAGAVTFVYNTGRPDGDGGH